MTSQQRTAASGDFVGETSFLAKGPMAADISVVSPARFISWSTRELEAFMSENSEMGVLLQRIMGQCLVRKLHAQTQ